jgi:hypothetical protein
MTKHRKNKKTQSNLDELVVIAYAEDLEQARDFETLLKNNDIPVMVKQQESEISGRRSIAVMVPEEYVDEAHVVIESQSAYDDFYDLTVDDEEQFGSEPLEDEL